MFDRRQALQVFFKENVRCSIWTCKNPKNMLPKIKNFIAAIVPLAADFIVRLEFMLILTEVNLRDFVFGCLVQSSRSRLSLKHNFLSDSRDSNRVPKMS